MAAATALILPESPSMKKAVSLINAIDIGRFPRLLTRILQKLHLKAVYHNVKPAALQQQLEAIHLTQDKAEAFGSAWSSMGQETIEKFRQRILAPHKLETVGWQLNLQMAHSAQAKLKSPQAVLQLGVSNEDSKPGLEELIRTQSQYLQRTDQERLHRPYRVPPIKKMMSMEKVLVEFSHKELFDFYNKLETIQAQLDSLT
ncbi:COMM domain-containing protein 10 isoform X4 [Mustela nigripes]|uniref:COMM domain-containing protein 10 isoform X4 n=1 Tax=Mustela nigripes TaxID=77151 RepID=UPI002816559D|nr:COMM domain-containing protein 10 isoform X4 [Mustela nigripes]